MKIVKSIVEKMVITDIMGLDPLNVFVEDYRPKYGKVTIECFGDCWSYSWGGLPETETMAQFFIRADVHYLGNKLRGEMKETIEDEDGLEKALKLEIIRQRRESAFTAAWARDLWESAEHVEDTEKSKTCYEIFGDDWWHAIPTKVNPHYEYLCRIINVVKDALKEQKGATTCQN